MDKPSFEKYCNTVKLCNACPLGISITRVPGDGDYVDPVIFLGEAPGAMEEILGIPFIGRSGTLLREIFDRANYNIHDGFITNTVRCRPLDNRIPAIDEIKRCSSHTKNLIIALQPKFIVCVGASAAKLIKIYSSDPRVWGLISKLSGTVVNDVSLTIDGLTFGVDIGYIYHPSFIMRNQQWKELYYDHILQMVDYIRELKKVS